MQNLVFNNSWELIIKRQDLFNSQINIWWRDIVIGFNEPSFRYSNKKISEGDLDSKLNARLIWYFLPAVQVAKMQTKRPRLMIISWLNMALRWNTQNEKQKTIMMIDNALKLDFLKNFFDHFFQDTFSITEYIIAQDILKIPESDLLVLRNHLKIRHPEIIKDLTLQLAKFKRPRLFWSEKLNQEAIDFINSQNEELTNAFKYSISHIFALADINFEWNYFHNPIGYLSIWWKQEKYFNIIRKLSLELLKDSGNLVFWREIIVKNNEKLVIEEDENIPTPYNWYTVSKWGKNSSKLSFDEVTFENDKCFDFYEQHKKLHYDIEYIYQIVWKSEYQKFWDNYRKRYFDLKKRYCEAYRIEDF